MTSTTFDAPARPRAAARSRALPLPLPRPELALLLVVAGVLNLWALSRNGWANEYYAGAVRAMSQSWHAFLYDSLDAQGAMTVDKPPLALWVQALSVRLFGFHSLSLLVPQALMGVASVGLVYDLTRRRGGRAAGFVAGAVLALTPISVAISRHNNADALLVLCLVGAVWAMVRALEDGRTRWVVLSGACVGLGFEAKMGAALLVVPALAAAWLWSRPGRAAAGEPRHARATRAGGFAGGGNGPFGGQAGVFRLLNDALGGQAGWLLGFALVAGLALAVSTRLRRADGDTGWLLAVGGTALTTAVAFSFAHENVVGIGGFSGRESEVTTVWLAQQVREGHIRWVLADSGGFGMANDGRVGAGAVMAAVQKVGNAVTVNGTTIYDLRGQAAALAAA